MKKKTVKNSYRKETVALTTLAILILFVTALCEQVPQVGATVAITIESTQNTMEHAYTIAMTPQGVVSGILKSQTQRELTIRQAKYP